MIHYSIDDFINAFLDLSENNYHSIWEQPTFARFKELHDTYGMSFSGYAFLRNDRGSLQQVPAKYAEEFKEASEWLKFGFHGIENATNYGSKKFPSPDAIDDYETAKADYGQVITELLRITGSEASIDRCPRIHYYAGTLADCRGFKDAKCGITGLISAEDDRECYYLDAEAHTQLNRSNYYHDGNLQLDFYRTSIRLENVATLAELEEMLQALDKSKPCLIFTHEKFLQEEEMWEKFVLCGKVLG
ncbi:MAG: hypothetical protein IJ324_07030 [Lachnospiraceae bacterium]|nr:hypothetical protein [Lachnospiraceae bacterium]